MTGRWLTQREKCKRSVQVGMEDRWLRVDITNLSGCPLARVQRKGSFPSKRDDLAPEAASVLGGKSVSDLGCGPTYGLGCVGAVPRYLRDKERVVE